MIMPKASALLPFREKAPDLIDWIETEPSDAARTYLKLQILALKVRPHLEPLEAYAAYATDDKTIIDPRQSSVETFAAKAPALSKVTMIGTSQGQIWFGSKASVKNVQINAPKGFGCIIFGPHCEISNAVIAVSQNPGTIIIGAGTTASHINIQVGETDDYVLIGDDCMFSTQVAIRTSDSHAILDCATGLRINHSRPVILHNHVWVARDVSIGKGAEIGTDSVIGQSSLVSGRLEGSAIHAGIPAKTLRRGTTWDRTQAETLEETRVIAPHRTRQIQFMKTRQEIEALGTQPLTGRPLVHVLSRLLTATHEESLVQAALDQASAENRVLLEQAHRLRVA